MIMSTFAGTVDRPTSGENLKTVDNLLTNVGNLENQFSQKTLIDLPDLTGNVIDMDFAESRSSRGGFRRIRFG